MLSTPPAAPIDPLKLSQEKTDEQPLPVTPSTVPAAPAEPTATAAAPTAPAIPPSTQQAALAEQLVRPMMNQQGANQHYGAVGIPSPMPSSPTDMIAPSLNANVAFGQQTPGAPPMTTPDYGNPAVPNPMDLEASQTAQGSPEWQRLQEYQRGQGRPPQAPPDPSMMQPGYTPPGGQQAAAPPVRMASLGPSGGGGGGGLDPRLMDFVKQREGFAPAAKLDHKQYSIGYGTRGSPGQTITPEQAEAPFQTEMAKARQSVEQFAPNAPPGVKDALTSLTFNAGTKWQGAGLGQAVLAGDYDAAKERFVQYVKASGRTEPGLVNRRNLEISQLWDGRGQPPTAQPQPYQVAQAGGQMPGPPPARNDPMIQQLQSIMNNPNAPREARRNAMNLLGQKLMQGEKYEYKEVDGQLVRVDPSGRTRPEVQSLDNQRFRPLISPEDRARYGIPAEDKRPYQVDRNNKLVNPPPETRVNIDQRAEDTFRKEAGKIRAEEYGKIVSAGTNARQSVADIQNLGAILSNIKTGKTAEAKAAIGPYAEMFGIKVDQLGESQAANSIIQRIAPSLRTPGVGAQSDRELANFIQSMPALGNTPEGNAIIQKTLESMFQNKTKAAEIAAQALDGEITRKEADKQIRELPDSMNEWREFMKKNPTGVGGTTKGGIEWKLQ
jgi:GH24 family phage-related lysozyme (muramidase)